MDWQSVITTTISAIIPAVISYMIARHQCKSDLSKAAQDNKAEIDRIVKQHEINIESLREQHVMQMEAKEKEHEYKIQLMQKQYELDTAEKNKQKKNEITNEVTEAFVKGIMQDPQTAVEKIQHLANLRDNLSSLTSKIKDESCS